jgi:hypothetical protein
MSIAHLQAWKSATEPTLPTIANAYAAPVSAGSTLVAILHWFGNGSLATPSPPTDTLLNTWTQRAIRKNTNQDKVTIIYVAENIASGGANTVTSTLASNPSTITLDIVELSGCAAAAFDQFQSAQGTTTVPAFGTPIVPSQDNEAVIVGVTGIFSSPTADTGFTVRVDGSANQTAVLDSLQTTATSVTSFMTAPASLSGWAAAAISLKAAAAAGAGQVYDLQHSPQYQALVAQ